jgi:hypothetical protein
MDGMDMTVIYLFESRDHLTAAQVIADAMYATAL